MYREGEIPPQEAISPSKAQHGGVLRAKIPPSLISEGQHTPSCWSALREGYVTSRRSWSAVSANTENMTWAVTFRGPRTRRKVTPNSSLSRENTRSAPERFLYRSFLAGSRGIFSPPLGLESVTWTPPYPSIRRVIDWAS